MRKTAATLTLAEPSHSSSNTTTHTTGVALQASMGGRRSIRTAALACEAAARQSATA